MPSEGPYTAATVYELSLTRCWQDGASFFFFIWAVDMISKNRTMVKKKVVLKCKMKIIQKDKVNRCLFKETV